MNSSKQLGKLVRQARGKMSLREFAKKCGISHTYLSDIEKGYDHNTKKEISVTLETLKKLSIATGYSVNYLAGGTSSNVSTDYLLGISDDPISSKLKKLPIEERISGEFLHFAGVAERLRELRQSKRITQKKIADILGVDRTTYTKYETGDREPDYRTLKKIADYYDVSIDYILGDTSESMFLGEHLTIPDELRDVRVALHRGEFEDLTQDEVDKLAEFAKFIKSQRKEK